MGIPSGKPGTPRVAANLPTEVRTSGQIDAGISKAAQSSAFQRCSVRWNASVREALLGSVTWAVPPDSLWIRKLSIVPTARRSSLAAFSTAGQFLRAHETLVPEK